MFCPSCQQLLKLLEIITTHSKPTPSHKVKHLYDNVSIYCVLVISHWCNGIRNQIPVYIWPLNVKVRSHQKRCDFFARPNPMKSQCTDAWGWDRRNIFPGSAFGATRCGRCVYSSAFSAAQFSPLVEIFQLWGGNLATRANQLLSRHSCPAAVESEQDGQ